MRQDEKNRQQDQYLGEPQLEESDKGHRVSSWSSNFPDPNLIKHLWDPLEQVWSIKALVQNPQDPPPPSQDTSRNTMSMPQWFKSQVQSIAQEWPEECDKKLKSDQLWGHHGPDFSFLSCSSGHSWAVYVVRHCPVGQTTAIEECHCYGVM